MAAAEISDRFLLNPVWIFPTFKHYSYGDVLATQKFYNIKVKREENKIQTLIDMGDWMSNLGQAVIVYCNSKKKVEWVVDQLKRANFTVSSVVRIYINIIG